MNYAIALATFSNSFNHLMSTRLLLVFPQSYCKHVLMKFHLCYVDYSNCPQSLGPFLRNGKIQILSLFINVSIRRWFQTPVAFCFLIFCLKFWKDKFAMRSLVLLAPILPTGSMVFCPVNPLSLNYPKLFINSLMLLKGDNKLMLFIQTFLRLSIEYLMKNSYLNQNVLVLVDLCQPGLDHIYLVEDKELCQITSRLISSCKGQFQGLYCS